MQKLARRSLSLVLAVMLVLTTIVGAVTVAAEAVEPFTEWTAGSQGLLHVGRDYAKEGDANWTDLRYMAQEFVPASDTLYGVELGMNVTGGEATIYAEIRTDVNDPNSVIAFGTGTTKGDNKFETFRTVQFNNPASVTPGNVYYVVYYLKALTEGNLCIVTGSDVGANNAAHPLWVWKQSEGEPITFSAGDKNVIANFKLVDKPFPFTGYEGVSETFGEGRFPLALEGATAESDPHFADRHHVAQEFVPEKDTLYGVTIGLRVGGEVTIHTEIRTNPNDAESVIASTNLNIVGDWNNRTSRYTFRFPEPVAVTPRSTYYIVTYMTETKTAEANCSVRADSRKDLPTWQEGNSLLCPLWKYKQSSADPTYTTGSGSLIADFKLVDTIEPFTQYTAVSATGVEDGGDGGVRFPLALIGATAETDGQFNNRQYPAQEFIPAKDTLYGVELGLKAGNSVTVRAEIRSEVNNPDSVLGYKDIEIQGAWYNDSQRKTFTFDKPISVTPGKPYYIVTYITRRGVNGDCYLRADSRLELKDQYTKGDDLLAPCWTVKQNADELVYRVGNRSLIADFKLIDSTTRLQWLHCDGAAGLIPAGMGSAFADDKNHLEGKSCGGAPITGKQIWFYLHKDGNSIDITGSEYVSMDVYVEKQIQGANIDDAQFNVSDEMNQWTQDGAICDKSYFKNFEWKVGWNHLVIPIDWSLASALDKTKLTCGRFVITFNDETMKDAKVMIDDICFLRKDDLPDNASRNTAKDLLVGIRALPATENLTVENDGATVDALKATYDGLATAHQTMVTNADVLATAVARIAKLREKNIVEVSMKNLDSWSGYAGNYNQAGSGLDTADYTQGTASWKFDVAGRNNMKPFIYGNNEGGGTNEAPKTTDISSVIDENGDFYFAYDIYVDDPATITSSRYVVGIGSRTATNTAANVDKAAMEICKYANEGDSRNNVTWAEMGLTEGPKAGWNHVAIKLNANPTSDTYTNKFDTKAGQSDKNNMSNSWDPKTVWYVQFYADGANVGKSNYVKIDDIRFMSVDAYEENFASSVAVKEAIIAINAIVDSNDTANIEKATEKLRNLSKEQLAQVTNKPRYDDIISNFTLDKQIDSLDTFGTVIIAAGNTGTNGVQGTIKNDNYTEGTGAHFSNWPSNVIKDANGNYLKERVYFSLPGLPDVDFSKAEYIAFDVYVHGFKSIFEAGKNDVNIGLGSAGEWSSQDLWLMGNTKFGAITNAWKEGWNHVLIPVSAPEATAVKNLKIYMENAIQFTADDPYVLFDDFRILNSNALETNTLRNGAKDVIAAIAPLTVEDTEAIAAAKEAYEKLNDEQKAMVTNYDRFKDIEEARQKAQEVIDQIAAIPADVTYAGKDQIDAAAEAYNALSDVAKPLVDNYTTLQGYQNMLAREEQAAANVVNQIKALPAVGDLVIEDQQKVMEVRAAYEALHADTKPLVGDDNLATLVAAEEQIDKLIPYGDDAKAQLIINAINKLPEADAVVIGDESAITAVNKMYNDATDAVKALVDDNPAKAKLDAVNAALTQAKADKAAADAVVAQINELPPAPKAADEAVVKAARDAYEALNEKAKAYVPKAKLDTLAAAEAAVEKDKNDIAQSTAVKEGVANLPEEITTENAQTVKDLKNLFESMSPEGKAMVTADEKKALDNAYKAALFLEPINIQFRAFDKRGADFSTDGSGTTSKNLDKTMQLEGTSCMVTTWANNHGGNQIMQFVYGYNQEWDKDYSVDGCRLLPVQNASAKDLYLVLDVYVSDASVIKNAVGDCGMGLDTIEPNKWGDMVSAKATAVKEAFKDLQNGWNHIKIPMTFGQSIKNDMLRVYDFRIYFTGVTIPDGFQMGLDDVRFMNSAAVETILPERNKAKDITSAIRAITDETSFEDQATKIVDVYNSLAPEYQELVIGYDEFFTAYSEKYADEIAAKDAADAAAAKAVDDQIAALNETITVADKEAIEAARAAYEALTLGQKNKVTKLADLEADEAALIAAIDAAAAKAVDDQIADLPEKITPADKEKVEAARAAYNDLTDAQKALVTKLKVLEAAEAALAAAIDEAAAKAVSDQIAKLPATDKLTLADEKAVNDARKAYDALTDAQKALVTNTKVLTAAEAQIIVLKEVKLGDVNEDGKFDAKDALMVLKFAVDKEKLSDKQQKAADVNKDGSIDAKDALEILKKAVNKPACF